MTTQIVKHREVFPIFVKMQLDDFHGLVQKGYDPDFLKVVTDYSDSRLPKYSIFYGNKKVSSGELRLIFVGN